ncbi:MAG: LCP family protein [Eubacterium sp.]|nr:LCP family protein [Eubacterium sp.]
MEKETYNIDDILSEVKKRKQEREESAPSFEIKTKNGELPAEKPNNIKTPADNDTIDEGVEQKVFDNLYVRSDNGIVDSSIEEEEKRIKDDAVISEKKPVEKKSEVIEKNTDDNEDAVIVNQGQQIEETLVGNDGFVDLLSFADNSELSTESQTTEKEKFFKTKKGKIVRNIIIVLLVIVLVAAAGAGIYVYKALNSVSDDDNNATKTEQRYTAMDKLIENFPEVNETDADHLSSLQDMIKTWYYNGAPCSSSHVLNVLLVGEDTRGDEILEEDTRADAAIIVSINTDNKQITLTSILRDTYAYWENVPGDETTGEFGKINGAMAMGGIGCYINCVEKMYKIDIDDYVIVNFDSFEGIVDELGGVDIEITSAEINEINNHQERYGYVTIDKSFEGNSGEMRLTGEQALAYCRIRKLDSDNMRADRQKTCLTKIFDGVRDGNAVTLLKVVNKLLPYVKTGFSTNEIISISKYALSQGWLSYDIKMTSVPNARINGKGAGGIYYGAWCWKADFPQDANYLQTLLYGRSSVVLAEKRVDILKCELYGFYNESLVPCYAVIYNNSYGEATTYESTTEEDTQTTN